MRVAKPSVHSQDRSRDAVPESACDLIGGLAQTMGASIITVFADLAPQLLNRFAQANEEFTKALILGCFGEVRGNLDRALKRSAAR